VAKDKAKPEEPKAEPPKAPAPAPKPEREHIGTGRWLRALGVVFVIGLALLLAGALTGPRRDSPQGAPD